MLNRLYVAVVLAITLLGSSATNIVMTNDDGWATAQIRAEYAALKSAGYNVILSAPAVNKSGSSSFSTTPSVLTTACEFDTCAAGSPAYGTDASDPNIHYVNGYPVDAVKYGIKTYAPAAWGSAPALVVSGTNVGTNLGTLSALVSGTIGAACEAALEGIPSVAFSGASGSEVSYTTLATTTLASTISANIYSALAVKFTNALLANSGAILPAGITLNVNFAATTSCTSAASYKFVLTRISSISFSSDVTTCGTSRLPTESSAITKGCVATVSVMDASSKGDVSAANQAIVLAKLSPILSCL